MGIEKLLNINIENILAIEEIGNLAVNDDGKFSVIWVDKCDSVYGGGLFMGKKDEESARTLADMAATNAVEYNGYEEDGETIAFGTEYHVYDSK